MIHLVHSLHGQADVTQVTMVCSSLTLNPMVLLSCDVMVFYCRIMLLLFFVRLRGQNSG